MPDPMPQKPSVLFVDVHNAGRSQMAAALLTLRSGGGVSVRSDDVRRIRDKIDGKVRQLRADLDA
jgi:protein-tyrosine-phosphatase